MPDEDLNDAIAEAATAATEEVTGSKTVEEPKVEEPVAEEPKEEPKVEEPAVEEPAVEEPKVEPEEDDPFELTAEQLDAINNDPNLKAHYRSMQKGFTKKMQAVSEIEKQSKSDLEMAKYLRENPDKALEILAEKRGRRLAPSETEERTADVVDELMKPWIETLGEENAAKFYPVLKQTVDAINQRNVQPLREQQEQMRRAADNERIAATVAKFEANVTESGREMDDEIQLAMAEKMNSVAPQEGVSMEDYLEDIYGSVMYQRDRVAKRKASLARLRKATATEPVGKSKTVAAPVKAITDDMSMDEAFAMATAMAEDELSNS